MEEGYFFQTICNGFKFQFILMMNVKRSFPDISQMEWFVLVVPEQQLVMYEEKNSMKCFKMKSHLDFLLNFFLYREILVVHWYVQTPMEKENWLV